MTGIGNRLQIASLSNCFVIGHDGPSDSYGGVMKIDQEQVQLMKRRGGVDMTVPYSSEGSPVKNSALTSTGIVPFMELLFEFYPGGGARWSSGGVDVECFHQSPGFRKFH